MSEFHVMGRIATERLAQLKSETPSGRAWAHYNRNPGEFVPLDQASEAKSGHVPGTGPGTTRVVRQIR